jgi:hypothetical protein
MNRRTLFKAFAATAAGIWLPTEPIVERAYSFCGGWGNAVGSVFVNGVWRAWIGEDLWPDRLVVYRFTDRLTHDAGPHLGTLSIDGGLGARLRRGESQLLSLWEATPEGNIRFFLKTWEAP